MIATVTAESCKRHLARTGVAAGGEVSERTGTEDGLKKWPYKRHSAGHRARIANHKIPFTASVQGMEGESEGHAADGKTHSFS